MDPNFEALEFPVILQQLQAQALSQKARSELGALTPYLEEDTCRRKMAETTAARLILETCGTPPLVSMDGLEEELRLAEAGAMLVPEQLASIAGFAAACRRLAAYLSRGESCGAAIASFGRNLYDLSALQKEIEAGCSAEAVYDEASPALHEIRRHLEKLDGQIREKLAHVLQSRKQYLADSFVSRRGEHYVLPVQRRYQNQFGGTVIEVSGKGNTVFMEPSCIEKLQAERSSLLIDEDAETRRILYQLTAQVSDALPLIRRNIELMELLDVLFAKAKYSALLKARAVEIGGMRRIRIVQGRHPLLAPAQCVPLDFQMDTSTSGVIITGPNTGGKTVATKTVGLLSLMAQCGLHIPCGEGTYIPMQDGYWCDIGDSQNIAQNLSTFSGHLTNLVRILGSASRDSLVLLDELGSGTDPAEGMGIAVAVLEELRRRGCMFLVTTHYPQVKEYAAQAEHVEAARMAFDRERLCPLYRLEMGCAGESCALYIAERLGLAPHLLARARQEVYGEPLPPEMAEAAMPAPHSRLVRTRAERPHNDPSGKFAMGDCVMTLPKKEIGVVYRPADENGYVIIQVKGTKYRIRHNRLQLKEHAENLYPPDYDFSIIFDTKANRRARHIISRRFDDSARIEYAPEDYPDYN